jgi:alkaline phosphatase D
MPAEAIEVSWQVADDEQMTKVMQRGTTTTSPDWAHSVHVEVAGLRPDRWYFYQFQAGGEASPVGCARTFPAADASPERLRFAVATCQHYEQGLYTAYEHMANAELDFVAHLGDYIYEGGPSSRKSVRKHNCPKLDTLDQYRSRYALYRSDPLLQLAHARFPWLVTWDDHEFDDNYAGSISARRDDDPAAFLLKRARAYQAYYEHMPLRRTSLPQGPDMLLYRRVPYGRLAEFFVLDTRQYRTDQPCGDFLKPPCSEVFADSATILGEAQEKWLLENLGRTQGRWNVLAQQVQLARVDRTFGEAESYAMDKWPGYEQCRRRVLKGIDDRKVSNPIVLTGDIHTNWASDLPLDFDDRGSKIVGSEFIATSLSSGGDGDQNVRSLGNVIAENPFVKFINGERGYLQCEVTPQSWRTDYQVVPFVTRPGAPLVTRASFVVENGKRGMQAG